MNDHADPSQKLRGSLRQRAQLEQAYRVLAAEQEANAKERQQYKIGAELRVPKWILGQVLTNVVYPIVLSYDPVLFVQLVTGGSHIDDLIDQRFSGHHSGNREERIEAVEHLIDAAKDLKELLDTDGKVRSIWYGLKEEHLLSRIIGITGAIVGDPDFAQGLIDQVTIHGLKVGSVQIEGLQGEDRRLNETQRALDQQSASNDSDIKRWVRLIHRLNQTVKPRAWGTGTKHPNTSQRRAVQSPDAAQGLRAELITDPVLPSKIVILNPPSEPPETLHTQRASTDAAASNGSQPDNRQRSAPSSDQSGQ